MRKEACPIQVMQNSPGRILGKRGTARSPERLVKREGMSTSDKKFRRCHAIPGFKVTRVDLLFSAPLSVACRTTRVFFEKGIGTCSQAYKLATTVQICRREYRSIQRSPPRPDARTAGIGRRRGSPGALANDL